MQRVASNSMDGQQEVVTLDTDKYIGRPETDFFFTTTDRLINVDHFLHKEQVSTAIPGTGLASNLVHDGDLEATSSDTAAQAGPASGDKALGNGHAAVCDGTTNGHAKPNGLLNLPDQLHMHDRRHSVSLPSTPRGDEYDQQPMEVQLKEQEGATGSGPGGHESPLPRGVVEGQGAQSTDDDWQSLRDHLQPPADHEAQHPETSSTPAQTTIGELPSGEPRALPHATEVAHFKDERGRVTITNPAVKQEEAPGPRNEIVLEPRATYIHMHNEATAIGDHGRVLTLTPNGEHEQPRPPSQSHTPTPADASYPPPSETPRQQDLDEHGLGRPPPPDGPFDWKDEDSPSAGHWQSAMDTLPTPHATGARSQGFLTPRRGSLGSASGRPGSIASAFEPRTPNGADTPRTPTAKQRPRPPAIIVSSDVTADDSPMTAPAKLGMRKGYFSRMLARSSPAHTQAQPESEAEQPEPTPPSVTSEMLAGTLPVMILKSWIDRDEDGNRTVPVLLGNLRFRIGDAIGVRSTNRMQTGREVFKIECEYGDGAIKWVVYRELRDFITLHTHYKAANIGTRVTTLRNSRHIELPEFPRHALPYWAREKVAMVDKVDGHNHRNEKSARQGDKTPVTPHHHTGPKLDMAGMRDALQQYLLDLIRAVIFRPESTRLCIFFELSALTVALAPRGGFQGKAGFLKIPSTNASRRSNQPGLHPSTWKQHREPKWFTVRESYFVATSGPEESEIYDVFIIDTDFSIERPKRAYRTGLRMISGSSHKSTRNNDDVPLEMQEDDDKNASQHTFYIANAQRRLKLAAKNARQMHQFIVSMERVAMQCIWAGRNRFDSFAPVRINVAAQWLVDGRDYFWNLSRAINMAKNRVYIHDWWISPEMYLRRPGDERYRLDNLLKRKAEEGVRIFIIIYNEVSSKTTPVDSLYVKKTLTSLHPNIMLQRSPSHLPNGTFYWSHHEKLCVVDETIAFMGGLDLCFSRWDTSQHILTDEDYTAPYGPDGPVWPGKDYFNERIAEFSDLDKPFEDVFNRAKQPRMPWHDVGLQLVGQPARDLCRHFVQRWNYLLRIKNHTRKMPFLLPPADFTERELIDLKLRGTCEVQICRSVGPWSMGTATKIEHSIQNAYVKSIQLSEHFVYIENQFFITSTVVNGIKIENRIGDALVERAIRAHRNGEKWRACIVIPLLPGYTHPIDSSEASSVRLILECQNRTICRGAHSIFLRLRKEGMNPDDYITFFSLRGWAKFKSGALTTEQVYIHGKTMIIDDRLVLCGSANINERSQRGDRDSELLAVVRDTDMIDGTMAGKPFKVGRYAHTLRMRLMREHVGVDVDAIEEDELMVRKPLADAPDVALWDPDNEQGDERRNRRGITRVKKTTARNRLNKTISTAVGSITRGIGENVKHDAQRALDKVKHPIESLEGHVPSDRASANQDPEDRRDLNPDGEETTGFASSVVPTLEEKTLVDRRPDARHADGQPLFGMIDEEGDHGPPEATVSHEDQEAVNEAGNREGRGSEKIGVPADAPDGDDFVPRRSSDLVDGEKDTVRARKLLRKHLSADIGANSWNMPTPTPKIDPNRFHDPLDDRFWNDMWVAVAVHNTQIFRKVFRCVPDDLVTSWAQYKAFANHMDKFGRTEEAASGADTTSNKPTHDQAGSGGGVVGPAGSDPKSPETGHVVAGKEPHGRTGSDAPTPDLPTRTTSAATGSGAANPDPRAGHDLRRAATNAAASAMGKAPGAAEEERKPSGENEGWTAWELEEMEELLNEVRGHLVIYPTRFLEAEDMANNFLFNQERILPLLIYD